MEEFTYKDIVKTKSREKINKLFMIKKINPIKVKKKNNNIKIYFYIINYLFIYLLNIR